MRDPIRISDAEQYGLRPLILYGLTAAGQPIHWITFSAFDQPRSLSDVLTAAWRNAEGLRGRPDILRVSRHLAAACPDLTEQMAHMGIKVEIADSKNKSLPSASAAGQKASFNLLYRFREEPAAKDIQTLCRLAQQNHNYEVDWSQASDIYSGQLAGRIHQWLSLPVQAADMPVPDGLEWKTGAWLWSWQASLPPERSRYFTKFDDDGYTWLIKEMPVPDYKDENDICIDEDCEEPVIFRHLVACWPNGPAEIAKSVGISLRDFQWFLAGKSYPDSKVLSELESLLGVRYDAYFGGYAPTGPLVMIARRAQPLKQIYDALSQAGCGSPCELIPCRGMADPSWSYILINIPDVPPSIVMAPRGARIADRLPEILLGYDGIKKVEPALYQDVVSTCARVCRDPAANLWEMRNFAGRYIAQWNTDDIWLPGEPVSSADDEDGDGAW